MCISKMFFFCRNHGIRDDSVTKISRLATVPKERLVFAGWNWENKCAAVRLVAVGTGRTTITLIFLITAASFHIY